LRGSKGGGVEVGKPYGKLSWGNIRNGDTIVLDARRRFSIKRGYGKLGKLLTISHHFQ